MQAYFRFILVQSGKYNVNHCCPNQTVIARAIGQPNCRSLIESISWINQINEIDKSINQTNESVNQPISEWTILINLNQTFFFQNAYYA